MHIRCKSVWEGLVTGLNFNEECSVDVFDKLGCLMWKCKKMGPRWMRLRITLGCKKWVLMSVYNPDIGSLSMQEKQAFMELLRYCLISLKRMGK